MQDSGEGQEREKESRHSQRSPPVRQPARPGGAGGSTTTETAGRRPYLLLVSIEEVLQGDDGLALVLLDPWRALAVPAGQPEGAQVQQRLQARRVVVDESEVLVLHRTAHLRTRSGSRFNHSRFSFFSRGQGAYISS